MTAPKKVFHFLKSDLASCANGLPGCERKIPEKAVTMSKKDFIK
jgi:hypothetical protein